jgi:hypothetical protein
MGGKNGGIGLYGPIWRFGVQNLPKYFEASNDTFWGKKFASIALEL